MVEQPLSNMLDKSSATARTVVVMRVLGFM